MTSLDSTGANVRAETDYPHVAGVVSEDQAVHLARVGVWCPSWVVWDPERGNPDGSKKGKRPINPNTLVFASSNDPTTAGSLKVALANIPAGGGVGALITDAVVGVVGLDFDHAALDGVLSEFGRQVVKQFSGTYVEFSPSGRGLRVFALGGGIVAEGFNRKLDQLGPDGERVGFEAYPGGGDCKRYLRMTGALVAGTSGHVTACQSGIDWALGLAVGKESDDVAKSIQWGGSGAADKYRDTSIDYVLNRLDDYRGNEGREVEEVIKALRKSAKDKPSGDLAKALALMRSGEEKSDEDFAILCEGFRRGIGSVEGAAELLRELIDKEKRPDVFERAEYHAGRAARKVLAQIETPGFNRNSFRAQVWGNLPGNAEDNAPAPLPDGMAEALQASGEGLVRTRHGKVIPTPGNVKTILITDPRTRGSMAFNESTQDVERCGSWRIFDQHAADKPGNLQDIDISFTQAWFLSAWGMNLKKGDVCEGIEMAARAKSYDPLRDSLLGLVWDGKPRVKSWLKDFAMVDDTGCPEYVSEAGICFLCGAAARALTPGCQFDTMLTVEGSGGGGKSTMFQILADAVGLDLFTDSVHDVTNSVHVVECTEGKFIVEIAELSGVRKASDVESLKKALVVRRDKVRKPYMRKPVELPRRFVFVGTTNSSTYIADPTGAASRRFLPVRTLATERNPIDRVALADVAPQLWAEAVKLLQDGQKIYIDPNSEAGKQWAVERGERQEDLPFEEEVNQLVIDIAAGKVERYRVRDGRRGGITANDAAVAMGLDAVGAKEGKYGTRVVAALRHRGFIALPKSNGARLWNMPPELFSAAARMAAEQKEETSL